MIVISSVPAEVREEIVGRADGVPLFAEELTKTFLLARSFSDRLRADPNETWASQCVISLPIGRNGAVRSACLQ